MKLFHFSEESLIEVFVPRVKENRRDMPPVVWAIDEAHEFTFYFPRQCPRIVYRRSDDINEVDRNKFFGVTSSNVVVTVEKDWYERIRDTTIYRYLFPTESFQLFDEIAGYYISQQTIVPLGVEPLDHLPERLMQLSVELRFTSSLILLRNALVSSTVKHFGVHKFTNAKGGF
ncbi:hypothetical protein OIN60_14110 [Paenibacillus sp. P96]|uniref:DUF4433 domain-containing protein n=1 Tax=Paenibacillus zeirhizosphaerae TaxID=2987519 RepID=A0ABT9FT81_9BACL|nr:DUF6886 family protein [Paenibacillus sp. P96]MDP4097906.1 hypothetical protein [Paenibacillus sp. P96]